MIKLKNILLEGRYDRLVGTINKAVFKSMRSAIAGSGTQEKPKKYKGYEVRKDPIPTQNLSDMFEAETRTIYVGEFADSKAGMDVDVELKLAVSEDGVKPGKFYIDGNAEGGDFPSIEIMIGLHPEDAESGKVFSKIQPVLRDLVRHEIEHVTHGRGSSGAKYSKIMRGDLAMRKKIRSNPELYYKYFLLPKEVDANIHGLYSKAKTMKQPYQKVVDDYLDSLVDDGVITTEKRKEIYKKWKKRIPKIGGIPTLR